MDDSRTASCKSCIKVYLCSNPEDSVVERRALRESVFPRLREHCRHTHGLDFKVIDPYEASDPRTGPDQQTRQQLLQACRESSDGPYLVALVGAQYGTVCLPAQVEVAEFHMLLQVCQRAGISTRALEKAYLRDENTIPPSFCLQRQTHIHTQLHPDKQTDEKTGEMGVEEEEEMRKVLQAAVSQCVQGGLLTTLGYYRSALDTDLRFALENCPRRDIKRCLVYVNKISNGRGQSEGANQPPKEPLLHPYPPLKALSDDSLLSQLCDHFLPSLVTSCQLLVYTTTSECDPRHGYTPARRRSYAEGLCQQLYSDLLALIDSSVAMGMGKSVSSPHSDDALTREQAEQEELCSLYSRLYDNNQPEEEEVRSYLEQRDTQHPLVVVGGPCTGKTVLLAHCAQQVRSWLSDMDPVVIILFTSLSVNLSPRHLLSSLCHQIAHRYNRNPEPSSRDPNPTIPQLRHNLSSLLSICPSPKQPLVLILDGLDQALTVSGPQTIKCLPSPLPPNIKLMLSISPTRTNTLHTLELHFPQSSSAVFGVSGCCVSVELGPVEGRGCVRMCASLLEGSGRRVTSGQQGVMNMALTSCPLTLYARLLHRHASLWTSASDVTDETLPVGVHSSITVFLVHLEEKHGLVLVSRALSYLTLSRTGLTEAELSDLLSSDDEVLAGYVSASEPPPSKLRVPEVEVERLLLDLKGFLVKRSVAGSHVLFWVSRHFGLVVCERYLSSWEMREEMHTAMADYFNGRWAYGRAKPLVISQNTGLNQPGPVPDTARMKKYIDRQPLGQPYVFNSKPSSSSSSPSSEHVRVNLRKLLELPYHLKESGRLEELGRGLMMSLEFHQAMLRAGLLGDLVTLLEDWEREGASQLIFPRERALLAGILRDSACLLWNSPMELSMVMKVRLLPFLGLCPELEGYAEEVTQGIKKRGSGLGVVLSPAPSTVPSTQCFLPEARQCPVTDAAGTVSGTVVVIHSDGSALVWRGREAEELKLSCEPALRFVSVRASGTFILLSTQCNTQLLWDVTGTTCFHDVRSLERQESNSDQHSSTIVEGFLMCDDRMCVWWKGLSYVSVSEVYTSRLLTHLQCQNTVRSVSFPSSGQFMYCGQEKGTVSIFDTSRGTLIAICSSSAESSVISVILSEDEREMACVDSRGHVLLWCIETKTHPKLKKECCSGSSHFEFINTDLSEESCILLVCKNQEIVLWDTCDWEQWDHFRAPHGKAFSQALLAQDGHLILASLEACPSVLVWRMTTGQCVLSLDTGSPSQPLSLLKMESVLSVVTQNGHLTTWDSDVICAAAMVPRTGAGVREVVLEPMGERFYVIDGSEMLWRWRLQTGRPETHFLHDGPVEKLCLSPDGSHLVSLSGEDVYVWQSDTGQNLHRIHGSRATEVLITSNGHIGVCVSQHGLSRVWKLASGALVCNIHLYLADAQVSPESTFLLGRRHGDLLAVSLWSGTVSKRFSCSERYERSTVVAFRTLPEHPDFVIVMAASGSVYTWNVTEETVCRQVLLPQMFLCQPQVFHMSSDGSFALLSTDDDLITLLDLPHARLCRVKAQGPVLKVCLDNSGRYAVYICHPPAQDNGCACDLHTKPLLAVVSLADGGRLGGLCLCKTPTALAVSEELCVYVGFQDGSVGVYSISDITGSGGAVRERIQGIGRERPCQCDSEPVRWLPLATPSITWPKSSAETT
ncbi:NACHT and WD repeat domain-containing protein 2-like [Salvelinus fontinalis]|uniref:NACHT and WD repeat domain-containing protein 2-like n=1 Tax=Salvelinus fontinalis TaxID=8038 RepID=UPI0024864313|nr:NACHT and WD repeat domain-containing protein 2-like [Salvelinus fontinalis]